LMMNGKGSEPISSNPSPMARKWKKSRSWTGDWQTENYRGGAKAKDKN
jgi:hypothetical protein